MMELKEIEITPETAKDMLQYNVCNRPLSKSTVLKYSTMMSQGEWYCSHQAIAFSKDEHGKLMLVDGQHRLEAVIHSKIPTKFAIIYDAIQTPYIDTVRNRTFIDNLNIFNKTSRYTPMMMSIFNLFASTIKYQNSSQTIRQKFCDTYFDTFLLVDSVYKKSKAKSGGNPMKTAFFIAINENMNKTNLAEKLENYMYIFNTGNVSADDPMGLCIKELRDNFYVQKREFTQLSTTSSQTFKNKKLASIFLYSIESYLNCRKYIPSIDMTDRLRKKAEKQFKVITNDN